MGLRTLFRVPEQNPAMVQLNITNRCNMVCTMCPREILVIPEVDLPVESAIRIIGSLKGVRRIALSGLGEPLLHPHLDRLIEFAEKQGIRSQTTTNGLLLADDERARRLIRTGLHNLAFSLEGIHDFPPSGHQNRKIAEIVENFLRIRSRLGSKTPLITVQIVLLHEVMNAMEEILEWAHKVGVDQINLLRVNALLNLGIQRPSFAEEEAFYRKLKHLRKKYPLRIDCFYDQIYPGLLGYFYKKVIPLTRLEDWCIKWSYYMYIDVNGDVFPCSGLFPKEKPMGNIFRHSLSEVWNGQAFRDHRSSRARRIPCRFCDNLRLKHRTSPGYEKINELLQEELRK